MKAYRTAGRMKAFLFILAILIVLGALIYTQSLVNRMRDDAREFLNFYADVYARAASEFEGEDYSFIFEQIIQRINFPIIISNERNSRPTAWKNIGIDPTDHSQEAIDKITERMHQMDESTDPIPLTYEDIVLGYIHYGDSNLIRELQWLPFIEIGVVALFILIGYMGYQTIRKSEQRLIWVGMARETAHQLGTPISSLLGWIELLREQKGDESIKEITSSMRQDVHRLEQIAARFSQISTQAHLKEENLGEIIRNVTEYIERRLPRIGKNVELQLDCDLDFEFPMNPELMAWALENLIKNGIDAIEKKTGTITIKCDHPEGNRLTIDVIDTGKGIADSGDRKNIFKPGYSTKKRGWGLGLSLTKRIIEEYHKGKLELIDSVPGEGTQIRITLYPGSLDSRKNKRNSRG
ncbi:MAG: HAMP domain-containing histidine kinase [Candidatus Marinimicrobia bacterium]|nr:HAMP domain-containing histidine kinase [Candidatus Neomarinimicrobiota bacterium]MCF7829838.1 HAMP domain-containing histidine kinase [Candidatus Neomarinimicrobiota bacterium]MCF7881729.1 HAMP domain-containing histidine kinase [Candidatus Neomarinimicrobiota bacterium]MCF8232836.1 HAMP domain-containing histidine kinase [Bacteroidales bacterium]